MTLERLRKNWHIVTLVGGVITYLLVALVTTTIAAFKEADTGTNQRVSGLEMKIDTLNNNFTEFKTEVSGRLGNIEGAVGAKPYRPMKQSSLATSTYGTTN